MNAVTTIAKCATTSCAYNDSGCKAFAVTIAGAEKASCATFIALDARGGLGNGGQVGACQRLECKYNSDLMCTAEGVEISATQECLAYSPR